MLRARLLLVSTADAASWEDVATRLRPFVARRVSPTEVDDVMQDIFLRPGRTLCK